MPIYEYTCRSCGADFEHWHSSYKNTVTPACPECKGDQVQRRFSAPGIRIAGGASSAPAEEAPSAPKPEVFGRKELNAALRRQGITPAKD